MNHLNYHLIKKSPEVTTGMGVDFEDLNVEDMPKCESCERFGANPHRVGSL